jgi:hypothetical protein
LIDQFSLTLGPTVTDPIKNLTFPVINLWMIPLLVNLNPAPLCVLNLIGFFMTSDIRPLVMDRFACQLKAFLEIFDFGIHAGAFGSYPLAKLLKGTIIIRCMTLPAEA